MLVIAVSTAEQKKKRQIDLALSRTITQKYYRPKVSACRMTSVKMTSVKTKIAPSAELGFGPYGGGLGGGFVKAELRVEGGEGALYGAFLNDQRDVVFG
jgi:hypothetical protein